MNVKKLAIAILICEGAGILGSIVTFERISSWYAGLQKPFLTPPNWVFGPAWTLLFFLMGISLYLLLESKKTREAGAATKIFFMQLGLNVLWSVIFFGLKQPSLAFIEVILLWLAIILTILKSWKASKAAAILLIPYLLWVSFAAALNFAITLLN